MAPKVLVVHDEAGLALMLQDMLRLAGCEVSACHDAPAAFEALAEEGFGVVLVKVFLSEHPDGLDLADYILAEYPHTSVILLNGCADEPENDLDRRSGVFARVSKPFNVDDILRVVGTALEDNPPRRINPGAALRL